jgi:transposase-like protein
VRLPSIEKACKSSEMSKKYSKEYKKRIVEEARRVGVKQVCDREGLGNSTVYYWMKDEREHSVDSSRDSMEKSNSSARSSLDKEPSTPVLLKDIKKEPGLLDTSNSSGTDSPSRYSYVQQQVKVVRKYTEQQKLEAAQRAYEIGHKQASIELDIPLTNVKRWFDFYKNRVIGRTKSTTGTLKEDKSGSSGAGGMDIRKRKLSETKTSPSTSYKRYKYTDEDRIAFVKETEIIGTTAVAAKAGVSMDLVYRWRSKFLRGIRAEREAAESANDSNANDDADSKPNSPQMPAPRNTAFDIASKQGMTIVDKGKSKNDSQFEYLGLSLNKNVTENSAESSDSHQEIDNEEACSDKQFNEIDFETYDSVNSGHDFSGDAYHGHSTELIEVSDDSPPDVHTIDDIDIIAADQIMEMTSRYMEAEKEHELNPFGLEKETREEKEDLSNDKNSPPDVLEDEAEIEKDILSEPDKTQNEKEGKSSITDTEKEGNSSEADVGMFKIVDIKSEASNNKI